VRGVSEEPRKTTEELQLTSRSFDRVRASTEIPMSLVTVIPETTCRDERA
jgi:hypothetical protein